VLSPFYLWVHACSLRTPLCVLYKSEVVASGAIYYAARKLQVRPYPCPGACACPVRLQVWCCKIAPSRSICPPAPALVEAVVVSADGAGGLAGFIQSPSYDDAMLVRFKACQGCHSSCD
jgi:hypothetical protein